MDDVERPCERDIEDDDKLDRWYENYKDYIIKKLRKYHKDNPLVDRGIPKPSIVIGG